MSLEFTVSFLLSADVFPSCGNSKLTTPNQVQSSAVGGYRKITTHADDGVHSQDNSSNGPS